MTAPTLSDKGIDLIISFEVSSPDYYRQVLQHPVWPGGASGVTIGIGYDLGQHSFEQFEADWRPHLQVHHFLLLAGLCRVKGDGARIRLAACHAAVVPFEAARTVFIEKSLPDYAARTADLLPNFDELSGDGRAALVSIAYNRGTGWAMQDSRHQEMREIRDAMIERKFDAIPDLIRAMKRLWSDKDGTALHGMEGLLKRRDAEADLFAQSLAPVTA